METFRVLATFLALVAVASAGGDNVEHVRKIIHVPFKIHTIHHHQVKKVPVPVPVVKEVPVYKTVEVPVVQKVAVPVVQKVHVPVHVPVQVPVHVPVPVKVPIVVYQKPHHESHEFHQASHNQFQDTYYTSFQDSHKDDAWQLQKTQGLEQSHEGGHFTDGYWSK
uniref:Uncharacterized protein n=1 Tax=Phlebotomus papatasi TaxID=29031 RepID=A0A1B0DL09_PHLPP